MDFAKLREPFLAKDVEWRVRAVNADRTNGMALPYITSRAIQDRRDGVVGPANWRNEFERWNTKGVKCGLSIWDPESREWITKFDGADETSIEATKGGFSDAMKRAAVQWGVGRYLYDLPAAWVDLENGRLGKETLADLDKRYSEYISKRYAEAKKQ